MRDGAKIALGALIALVLITLPLLWNAGRASAAPQPDLDTPAIRALPVRECVESAQYMRQNHMRLLKFWRDAVVRRNARVYVSSTGREYEMSLQKTCTKCHSNKAAFCDRCHDWVGAKPSCWDCHLDPEALP